MISAPIHLISSMATRLMLSDLALAWERRSGYRVHVESIGGVEAAKREILANPAVGEWWMGVWERLLLLAPERGVQLGMTFLDGTSIRAHQKAAGAARKGALKLNETHVKRLVALVAAMAPRLA